MLGSVCCVFVFLPRVSSPYPNLCETGQKSHRNDVATLKQDKIPANAPQQNVKEKMNYPKIQEFFPAARAL